MVSSTLAKMKRLTFVVTGLLIAVCVVSANVPRAQGQTCNPVASSSAFTAASFPEYLATGRKTATAVLNLKDWMEISEMVPNGVTLTALGSSGNVISQTSATAEQIAYDSEENQFPLKLSNLPAAGGIQLVLAWTEEGSAQVQGCYAESSIVVRKPGTKLAFRKWLSPRDLRAPFSTPFTTCDTLAVSPIVVSVTTTNQAKTVKKVISLKDQCDALRGPKVSVPGATLALDSEGAWLSIHGTWKGFRYFDLSAAAAGKNKKQVVSAYYYPEYRVWQGQDEYWNYCIKKNRDVKMDQGYLYCLHPWSIRWWFGKLIVDGNNTIVRA